MEITWYDQKSNTLYIHTKEILPKGKLSLNEHMKCMSLSYQERISKFASKEAKAEIEKAINEHKGCIISEYTSI